MDEPRERRTRIDVAGLSLSIQIAGSGVPPIVFLNSSGGDGDEWDQLMPLLPLDATAVRYGRPGLAGSDPLPGDEADREHGPLWAAEQLRGLLSGAGVKPPYVLVSSSLGGWILSMYAVTWPEEVAGAVLVDPTMRTPWPDEITRGPVFEDGGSGGIRFPMGDCFNELQTSPAGPVSRCVVVSSSVGRWQRDPPENPWYEPLTLDQVDELWQGYQHDWTQHLAATHVIADTAGHFVHQDQPELVSLVVHAVLDAARSYRRAELDPVALNESGGYLPDVGPPVSGTSKLTEDD